jgi:hypothetical protein
MTSYNYSYNVLINRLEAFAAGHFLIRRFTHGQIDMSDTLQDDQYPFMHVTPDTIEPVPGAMNFGFHIMFADIPRDKEYKAEYQREVISDCIRLGQDLIAEVKNGLELFGFDVQLLETPTFEPFMEEQKNTVTGVAFTMKLSVPWDWSACDIPAIWSVGGASGTGGEGIGYGITLRTNGVDNVVQTLLDLVEGTNITITDLGNGQVQIDSTGGGGGGGEFVSTEYNANHTTATGNQYVVGDRVWYNGNVYRCIANNDALLPTNTTYWTLVAVGYRLRQTPVDWNASTGDFQILNKPTIPAAQVNSDWNSVSGVSEILNKPTIPAAQVNSDWTAASGVSQILNKPTLATVATSGSYNDLINQPSIPPAQVNSDWNAVSGVAQILNKPTIPAAQVNSDWNAVSGLAEILNKPTIPTSLPPNGAAAGDLQGTYPNPTVHRIHSYDMQSGLPSDGDTWVVVPTPLGTQPVEWQHKKLNVTQLGDTTTVGQNIAKLTNPNAITFLRVNADNSVTARTPAQVLTDLGVAATIILARDFGTYTLTSSTTNTLVWSAAIAANTFQTNDMIEWFSQMNTNAGNGVRVDYRLYINTSASLVGAQLIGTSFNTVGTGNLMIGRNIFVTASGVSGNLRVTSNAANAASSFGNSSVNATNITIDTTITQYLIIAIQHQTTVPTSSVVSTLIRTTR